MEENHFPAIGSAVLGVEVATFREVSGELIGWPIDGDPGTSFVVLAADGNHFPCLFVATNRAALAAGKAKWMEPKRPFNPPVPKPAPFWMVINVAEARGRRDFFDNPLPGSEVPEHHRPRAMHDTEAGAAAELLRLAKAGPEGRFVLLQAVAFADGRPRQRVETVTEYFVEPLKS